MNYPEIKHLYGDNIHLLSNHYLQTQLAWLCSPKIQQPQFNEQVARLYDALIQAVIHNEFPRVDGSIITRMGRELHVSMIDQKTQVCVIDVMRAGQIPALACFGLLNNLLEPKNVRQDHVLMSRQINPKGQVIGSLIHDSKIGGSIEGRFALVPDPMGATGSSLSELILYYEKNSFGKPRKWILMNLIITPEYIRKIKSLNTDVTVYALRVDRGNSSKRALDQIPGTFLDEESGLDERQYIVPGGGGFGELMNNTEH